MQQCVMITLSFSAADSRVLADDPLAIADLRPDDIIIE